MKIGQKFDRLSELQADEWRLAVDLSFALAFSLVVVAVSPSKLPFRLFDCSTSRRSGRADPRFSRSVAFWLRVCESRLGRLFRCLHLSLAASLVHSLHNKPFTVHVGVGKGANPALVRAHAWVLSGEVAVTGIRGSSGLAILKEWSSAR